MVSNRDYIVFTDLDGSLLNHEDYSFEDAKEMISFLKEHHIPIIIVTSKTKNEVIRYQKEMGIDDPFIVENGAAVFYPTKEGYEITQLGVDYKSIKACLERVKEKYDIKGFSDMNIDEIMAFTGLDLESAKIASKREFSEPFVIKDERILSKVEPLVEKCGLKIMKGGRFYHCMSIHQDKGKAVKEVIKRYKKIKPSLKTVALGDNYNDIPMLKEVDIPVLIPRYNHKFIEFDKKDLIHAKYPGSKGWSESLKRILG